MSAPSEGDPDLLPPGPARLPDQLSPERFTLLALTLALLVGVLGVVAQYTSSQFYADDYLYLQLARQGSLTPSWLVIDNYGHFAPLTRLAYFAVQRTLGLDYTVAAILPATLAAAMALTLAWIFRELLGRRWSALGLALLAATSIPLLRTLLWWGAAVHVLGAATMMTLSVAAFVVHCRRGGQRYRLLSLAALATGLLVQERPIITVGYLVLIRYLFGLGVPALRPFGAFLRRELALWAPYVALEIGYFVYRLHFFASEPQPGTASEGVRFIGLSVVRGWAPTLVGSRVQPYDPLLTKSVVAGLLAVVVVVLVLARRRLGWWRPVAFLVAIYVANLGIVAAGRLSVGDLRALAADLQYYVDVHVGTVLALVLGFTLLPMRPRPGSRRQRSRVLRLVVPVAAALLFVSTAVTAHAMLEGNPETVAHRYMYRALSELHAQTSDYALMRTKLPVTVAPSFIDPFSDTSAVMSLDHQVADRLDPTSPNRLVVLSSGRVTTAHPSTVAIVAAPSQRVTAGLGSLRPTGQGSCLTGPQGAYFRVKLPQQVDGVGVFFAMTYSSDQEHHMLASARSDGTVYNWSETDLPAGSNVTVVDRLEATSSRTLNLSFADGLDSDVCLTQVWIGRIAAVVDGTCQGLDDHADAVGPALSCTGGWEELAAPDRRGGSS